VQQPRHAVVPLRRAHWASGRGCGHDRCVFTRARGGRDARAWQINEKWSYSTRIPASCLAAFSRSGYSKGRDRLLVLFGRPTQGRDRLLTLLGDHLSESATAAHQRLRPARPAGWRRRREFAAYTETSMETAGDERTWVCGLRVQQDGGDGGQAARAGQVQCGGARAHPVAGGPRAAARDLAVQRRARAYQHPHLTHRIGSATVSWNVLSETV